MIARLRGVVEEVGPAHVVVDVQGVGYEVQVTGRVAQTAREGAPTVLFVHTAVREDAITLYGFASAAEKATFEQLIAVSQVGPKLGLSLLTALTPNDLARAVEGNDLRALTAVSGVGKKTAERLVLELRGKLAWSPVSPPAAAAKVAPDDPLPLALAQLGYKKTEIDLALVRLAEKGLTDAPLQQRISAALAGFAGR